MTAAAPSSWHGCAKGFSHPPLADVLGVTVSSRHVRAGCCACVCVYVCTCISILTPLPCCKVPAIIFFFVKVFRALPPDQHFSLNIALPNQLCASQRRETTRADNVIFQLASITCLGGKCVCSVCVCVRELLEANKGKT